jgi:hypothetical protein
MITTVGSVFLAFIVQGSGLGTAEQVSPTSKYPAYSIRLTGYDTRDGDDIMEILSIDNKFDKKICTFTCQSFADNTPRDANPGTEFIVLQIKNVSPNQVFLKSIQVNGVSHSWDMQTVGKTFDASASDSSGKYPLNGKFSILPMNSLTQKPDNKLSEDEEVRLVVKLSKTITSDILLSKPIHVFIDFGSTKATEFVIMSGDKR